MSSTSFPRLRDCPRDARHDLPAAPREPADAPPLAHRPPADRLTTDLAGWADGKGPLLPGLKAPARVPLYGGRHRVKGLRREEVAILAGMSTDYYTRLERETSPECLTQSSTRWLAPISSTSPGGRTGSISPPPPTHPARQTVARRGPRTRQAAPLLEPAPRAGGCAARPRQHPPRSPRPCATLPSANSNSPAKH